MSDPHRDPRARGRAAPLRVAGLDDHAIARVVAFQQDIACGSRSELTVASKYLLFAKYLVDGGRINEEGAD